MTTVLTFADLEAIVRKGLADANISGIGTRWFSELPAKAGTAAYPYPIGTVRRTGGQPAVRPYLDAATIEIEVWGTTKSEARTISALARTAIYELEGDTITNNPVSAVVNGIDDASGLEWDPDKETGRDKYKFAVTIYGR